MKKFKAGDLKVTLAERVSTLDRTKELVLKVTATKQMNVDRDDVAAWSFGLEQRSLATRLKACIEAGKAFLGYTVARDDFGKTYVREESAEFFHGRYMNSSLKKLGY